MCFFLHFERLVGFSIHDSSNLLLLDLSFNERLNVCAGIHCCYAALRIPAPPAGASGGGP